MPPPRSGVRRSDSSRTTLNCSWLVGIPLQGDAVTYPFVLSDMSIFTEALGQYCPGRDDGEGCFGEEVLDMGQGSCSSVLV